MAAILTLVLVAQPAFAAAPCTCVCCDPATGPIAADTARQPAVHHGMPNEHPCCASKPSPHKRHQRNDAAEQGTVDPVSEDNPASSQDNPASEGESGTTAPQGCACPPSCCPCTAKVPAGVLSSGLGVMTYGAPTVRSVESSDLLFDPPVLQLKRPPRTFNLV